MAGTSFTDRGFALSDPVAARVGRQAPGLQVSLPSDALWALHGLRLVNVVAALIGRELMRGDPAVHEGVRRLVMQVHFTVRLPEEPVEVRGVSMVKRCVIMKRSMCDDGHWCGQRSAAAHCPRLACGISPWLGHRQRLRNHLTISPANQGSLHRD